MRIEERRWIVGPVTAALVAAVLGYFQLWLMQWTGVFTWGETFCGSADYGDESAPWGVWVYWCTANAILAGTMVGWWTVRKAFDPDDLRPLWWMLAAAGGGSLTVLAAVRGLLDIADAAAGRGEGSSCMTFADQSDAVIMGVVVGLICTAVALLATEARVGMLCGWVLVWMSNALVGILNAIGPGTTHSHPLELRFALTPTLSMQTAQWVSALVPLAAMSVVGLTWFGITRSWRRGAIAGLSVHALIFWVACGVFP